MSKWLKKYMKIEYLEDLLLKQEIYLGDPGNWDDLNDRETINIYKIKNRLKEVRAACMTMGIDQYHFWALYGGRKAGICLWFHRDSLIEDIKCNPKLKYGEVTYHENKNLQRECILSTLPFAKRKQFKDEKEFRVLREFLSNEARSDSGIKFRRKTLARVYFNSWLSQSDRNTEITRAKSIAPELYGHVEFIPNRTIRHQGWVDAARSISDTN